jgi:AmmeMemoRadiSam system protein A
MDIYTKLAYDTIKLYLTKEELPDIKTVPLEITTQKAGCFVSLHKKDGSLRGCIGTIRPMYKNLSGEIEANAVAAATTDPRFEPLKIEELDDLNISVDVLGEPEQIFSEEDLDIKKYGLIVQASDGRDGLLLPNIKGVNSVAEQITIAREKGEIAKDEEVALFRFTVERHN